MDPDRLDRAVAEKARELGWHRHAAGRADLPPWAAELVGRLDDLTAEVAELRGEVARLRADLVGRADALRHGLQARPRDTPPPPF